jgi:cation:H+ antiporter
VVLAVLLLLGGAAVLTAGAEVAIRGASRFAEAHRVSPFVLGALLFGLDLESLGAALVAAGRNQTSIAVGEAFGTILFLFSAAFGAALLVSRKPVEAPSMEMVLLPALALATGAMAISDQVVTRLEGGGLIGIYLLYIGAVIWEGRAAQRKAEEIERESREGLQKLPPSVLLLVGLGLVYMGATVLVDGGVRILDRTSLAAGFVGAALIGALASLDEVLLEVIPVLRGMPGLATGNLFGTVAAFATGVIGLASMVRPLEVDSAASSAFIAASIVYTVVAVAFLFRGRAGKVVGLVVLAVYALWLLFASRI